jgi:hypothetical protein
MNIRQPRKDGHINHVRLDKKHDMQPDPFDQPLPRHFALPTRLVLHDATGEMHALVLVRQGKNATAKRAGVRAPRQHIMLWRRLEKSLERDALGFANHLRTVENTNSATSGLKIWRTALL